VALIDDIKKHEGFSSVVYKCTAGYDTIGYGKRIKYLQVTEEQATEWLKEDLENLKYTLSTRYSWFLSAPQEVKDIVINMNYQLGVSAFSKFKKTIKYIANKDYQMASVEMLDSKWARNDTPRRAKELSDRMAKVE
jgi:lysozyme|tara:strand:- start:1044 stop:1451 length:408 start_codon:yes stop_codon:yes gene_type:complete